MLAGAVFGAILNCEWICKQQYVGRDIEMRLDMLTELCWVRY